MAEILSELPTEAARAYLAARSLMEQHPDLAAERFRKALDLLCLKFGGDNLSLADKIRDLSARGHLPAQLLEAVEALRIVDNVGARESPSKAASAEAWILDSLFKLLAQYLYVLPAKTFKMRSITRHSARTV
jgi:hypothetical protein